MIRMKSPSKCESEQQAVALVNCCRPDPSWKIAAPQASLCLATALHNHGIRARIYDTAVELESEQFTPSSLSNYLLKIPQRVLCVSLWDSILPTAILALRQLKQVDPSRIVIIGGPSSSAMCREILINFPWINYACVGEGEVCLVALLKYLKGCLLDKNDLPSRVFSNDGGKVTSGTRHIASLSSSAIPRIDYSLVDMAPYSRVEVITSRGCPYSCSFCSVHLGMGRELRFRDMEDVFYEIDILFQHTDATTVHILDDNFGTDKKRFDDFCSRFGNLYPEKHWSCYFRLQDLTDENVEKMHAAGCVGVFVGVESGSLQLIRRLGKGFLPDEIQSVLRHAASKFNVTASFIWGFPNETRDDLFDTLDVIDHVLDIDNVFVNLYQLAPMARTRVLEEIEVPLAFGRTYVSGVIQDPNIRLSKEEENIIIQYPDIFSSYYHQQCDVFYEKYEIVNHFLGNDENAEVFHAMV